MLTRIFRPPLIRIARNIHNGPKKGEKVVVAMSGGVDSSVTASLLSEQNFDLSAVFMRNWDTRDEKASDTGCEWEKDWEDVQRVCKILDLPCQMLDLSQQYWNRVFEPSLNDWGEGVTPNPDVSCNREIKFGALMNRVITHPNQWLATGHYAQIAWSSSDAGPSRPKLLHAADRSKDQAYYLSSVPESQLRQTIFPLGHLPKSTVRELAQKRGLPTASRSESMGLCFIGKRGGHFDKFLSNYMQPQPGNIIDTDGNILGRHSGLWTYTIGQGARLSSQPTKMFVARKNPMTNEIVVVPGSDHPALQCTSITVKDWHWIWPETPRSIPIFSKSPDDFKGASVQIRTRMDPMPCVVVPREEGRFMLNFQEPITGVPPGQMAVLWNGDWCLGSGKIESTSCLA